MLTKTSSKDEVAWVQEADGRSSKASLYSRGAKETEDPEDPNLPDQLDSASVWLDAYKDDKHGTRVIRRDTDEVLFTFARAKRWTKPEIDMFRGEASQEEEEREEEQIPFCSIKSGWSGNIHLMYRENPTAEPLDVPRREFLKQRKWWTMPERFEVDGVKYRITMPVLCCMGRTTLTVADDPNKEPLCVIRQAKNPFGELRNTVEILPRAIATEKESKPNVLMQDNSPTKLFELTLAADYIYRQYVAQLSGLSAASSSSSSAAVAIS